MSDENLKRKNPRSILRDAKSVVSFACGMWKKLIANGMKSHWSEMDENRLFERLREEVDELEEAFSSADSDTEQECFDVGNFVMMIRERAEENRKNWTPFD